MGTDVENRLNVLWALAHRSNISPSFPCLSGDLCASVAKTYCTKRLTTWNTTSAAKYARPVM